jgi:5-hydroxyisourate hydrolase-like protein (transthyretin family)
MNKKLVWGVVLLLNVFLLTFSSCSEDDENDPAKPVVNLKELGSGHDSPNDKVAYIGEDAHIEAEIVAEGLIKQIEVEVHQKDGSYEFNKVYTDTKYAGKQNTTFHEHLEVPSDAVAGEYHLHLTVTDQFGQSASAESDLTLKAISVSINIDGFTFGTGHDFPDNKIGYIGTAPVIEATSIKAENGVDKIYVMLHSEEGMPHYEMEATFPYNGETELTAFHKHISIPNDAPAGDYHLHFKVFDKKGETLEKTMDIQIKETGITISDLEIGEDGSAKASNIHTEFVVEATDPLQSIRVRVYKANATTTFFVNETFTEDFNAGNVKEYTFHMHLKAENATPGEYVMEILVNDNKGAYILLMEQLTIVAE